MNRFTRILCVGVLALTALAPQRAEAGRIGGPMVDVGTIAPGQTVTYDVPFAGGMPASVAVMGNGAGNVELYIFDADGHVVQGDGEFERRVATMNVYRAGYFRVVLRNTGAVASTVTVGTN